MWLVKGNTTLVLSGGGGSGGSAEESFKLEICKFLNCIILLECLQRLVKQQHTLVFQAANWNNRNTVVELLKAASDTSSVVHRRPRAFVKGLS